MDGFIDIHCHLLPGVDDGPSDFDGAIAMARALSNLGFKVVAASPHMGFGPGGDVSNQAAEKVRLELQAALDAADIVLTVLANGEHYLTPELIEKVSGDMALTIGGNSRWLLVEPPWPSLTTLPAALFRLQSRGVKVVVAHPERYGWISLELAQELVKHGVKFQADLGSFWGFFGPKVQRQVYDFLELGLIHIVGTDLHSFKPADAWLRRGLESIGHALGDSGLELGLRDNPWKIINDAPVETILAIGGYK